MKPVPAVALVLAVFASGCASTNLRLNPDYDDPYDASVQYDAQSPDGFVERLGDPDEWRNEGEGSDLRMIAVWRCLDGKDREVVWRQQESGRGVGRWIVVSDTTREADCD